MVSIKKIITLSLFVSVYGSLGLCVEAPQWRAIFAHGLGGNALQGVYYRDLIGCEITGENGPEWNRKVYGKNVGPQQSCLAQDADIAVIIKQITGQPQILLGISKGGATMINTVGWLAVNAPEKLKHVKAVIVDSPFASPAKVASNIVKKNVSSSLESSIGTCVGSCTESSIEYLPIIEKVYPNYKSNGITPIKAVLQQWQHVDRDMVIVFIHSKEDELISINDSRLLYRELQKLGFKSLYLIEASKGSHGNVCWGPESAMIARSLGLIYRKHNLPLPQENSTQLNCLYAAKGDELLLQLQPSMEEIHERLNPPSCIWQTSSSLYK